MKAPKPIEIKSTKKSSSKDSILNREINLFPHRISDREKELIYRQLAVLQKSGVDIRTSFEILFKQLKNRKTRNKLEDVLNHVIKGNALSESMAKIPDFSPYEVFSLKIGEETGRLTLVLEKMMSFFDNKVAQRKQVVSALSYPVLIVFTSMAAITFMIFFIIPMFEEVFSRFNKELPGLTKWVIQLSHATRSNGWILILAIGSVFIGYFLSKKNIKVRKAREWMILKTPLVGSIYKDVYLARFSDSMSLLITASVPLIKALDLIYKMIGFVHIEIVIEKIKIDLMQGKSLDKAFEPHVIFDDQMKALIKVGEEVNQLGPFFQKMADDYTNNVKHRTALLSTFLEPFMIVFLGLVVGVILIAMYLPMFELSSSMDFGN